MWAAWVIAAVALAAVAFMFRFLVALLRESTPSVCYWVVPVRRGLRKQMRLETPSGTYFEDNRRATEYNRGACCLELLENQGHVKEENTSDLVTLDLRPASFHLGWRAIHPSRGNVFLRRWL